MNLFKSIDKSRFKKANLPVDIGLLNVDLTTKEIDYLWRCIEKKGLRCNDKLAGHIGNSYELMDRGDWFWTNTLFPTCLKYAAEYANVASDVPTSSSHPFYLSKWWVNYMKQTEFNPIHSHTGAYSFVIWMKVPYKWKDQNKIPLAKDTNNEGKIGTFEFMYNDPLGRILSLPVQADSSYEGKMLFFPSRMLHTVYPFYNCDEERISIAGNILLKTK